MNITLTAAQSTYEWLNDDKRWKQPQADPQFIRDYYGTSHHITARDIVDQMRQADYAAHIAPGSPGSAEYMYELSNQVSAPVTDPIVHFESFVNGLFHSLSTGLHTIWVNGQYVGHFLLEVLAYVPV